MATTPAQVITFTGTMTVGGVTHTGVTGTFNLPGSAVVTLPVTPPVTPPPVATPPTAGTVPFPSALATGHALLEQHLPADLYSWRLTPGGIPVTNGSGVTEDPNSPRNVSVTTDGGLSVLKLAVTSAGDCGVIQSPGQYTTATGVVEALVKFSGFTNASGHFFAGWASLWMYGPDWPAQGEIDAVESQYGNSFVSYHYGSGSSSEATTDPWTYPAKTVQLSPENSTAAPVAPNIVPDAWTHVTLAFGKGKCDVYYNGTLYCTISGSYVTNQPMFVTAGISFGAATLGASQAPYDQPGTLEVQYVRVFS
jgi:hypothetical protein